MFDQIWKMVDDDDTFVCVLIGKLTLAIFEETKIKQTKMRNSNCAAKFEPITYWQQMKWRV